MKPQAGLPFGWFGLVVWALDSEIHNGISHFQGSSLLAQTLYQAVGAPDYMVKGRDRMASTILTSLFYILINSLRDGLLFPTIWIFSTYLSKWL